MHVAAREHTTHNVHRPCHTTYDNTQACNNAACARTQAPKCSAAVRARARVCGLRPVCCRMGRPGCGTCSTQTLNCSRTTTPTSSPLFLRLMGPASSGESRLGAARKEGILGTGHESALCDGGQMGVVIALRACQWAWHGAGVTAAVAVACHYDHWQWLHGRAGASVSRAPLLGQLRSERPSGGWASPGPPARGTGKAAGRLFFLSAKKEVVLKHRYRGIPFQRLLFSHLRKANERQLLVHSQLRSVKTSWSIPTPNG